MNLKHSYGVDLEPCWGPCGLFRPERLAQLTEYIEKHAEYHIISQLKNDVCLNKPISNCLGYFLGDGDKDPEIIYAGVCDPVRQFDVEPLLFDDACASDPFKLLKNKSFS